MSPAERDELVAGLEHAARVSWRAARDPEHSWDRATSLRMAERLAYVAREVRNFSDTTDRLPG